MPAPTYTLVNFNYTSTSGKIIVGTITQVIDGEVWTINKRGTGADAENIWNHRGDSETDLITLLLAL